MRIFRKLLWVVAAVLIAAEIFIVSYFFIPNTAKVNPFAGDRKTYFMYEETVDTEGAEPVIINNEIMLPFDTVKRFIDPRIWMDEKNSMVTVTTQNRIIRLQTDNLNAMINGKPITLNLPVRNINGTVYVPVTFLNDFYNIRIRTEKFENTGVTVIIADPAEGPVRYAYTIKRNVAVRTGKSIRDPVIKSYRAINDAVTQMSVFGESEYWFLVRTADGAVGYVRKTDVRTETAEIKNNRPVTVKTPWKPAVGKLNMTWQIVANANPDTADIPDMAGLDVISPTWFEMSTAGGELINRAEKGYVDWAHGKGYKVWATMTNNFTSPQMTHDFLTDSEAKDNLIRKILAFAALYELDGINIDFENINKSDRDALTQFVREITPFLREQGLVVSMDVNIPDGSDNWSLCYDHKGLGQTVDYLMLMAYDQYWASGSEAGSVSQIPWVESNIKKVLLMVPAEKLVLGIPLYTRLWKVVTAADGTETDAHVGVLTMDNARKRVADYALTPVWEEASGQFYTEYVKDGVKYMLWLEDANSIAMRAGLVLKYKLAGTSAWQLNDASEDVWPILVKNLKTIGTYSAWQAAWAANPLKWLN